MKNLREFKPIWKLMKEDKKKIILATFLILIVSFGEIFTGYLNGAAVEAITDLYLKKALIFLVIYFVIRLFVDSLCKSYSTSILEKVENAIANKLSYNIYKKSLDLPSSSFEERNSGEIINRITNDTASIRFMFNNIINTLTSLLGSLIVLVYIFINSWIIGVEIVIFLFLILLVFKKYNKELKKTNKEVKKENDKHTLIVTETIRGIREVKTLGIKSALLDDIKLVLTNVFDKSKKEIDIKTKVDILTRILRSFIEVGVFVTCVFLLYYGKTSLTFFIAMTYYVYRYMWLIESLNGFNQQYQKVIVSLKRINELIDNNISKSEEYGQKELVNIKGKVKFEQVNFGYPNEELIFNNLNLELEPNQKIAIVGKSGQGKSTIFNLLTRIFDPTSGTVFIDDTNIKDLTEENLRKIVSIIRQEPFVFNRSIKENFQMIDSKIKLKTIRSYCQKAYLDDYIMTLPNKYDTVLGEGGVNLSGGQKQRLSIARTLAKKSKIILFDEATSALDNNSQEYIKEAINELSKDHTVIIIAHRLSTIIDSDIIYVLDKGKIVDFGKHEELIIKNKNYKELYNKENI